MAAHLASLKEASFTIKEKFLLLEQHCTGNCSNSINIAKLLYCLNYKKETLLYFGWIMEEMLNYVADLYLKNNLPLTGKYSGQEQTKLTAFIDAALGQKGDWLSNLELFGSGDQNRVLHHKICGLSILRNYSGHSKYVNEFMSNNVLYNDQQIDNEIAAVAEIVCLISSFVGTLKKHHSI